MTTCYNYIWVYFVFKSTPLKLTNFKSSSGILWAKGRIYPLSRYEISIMVIE